MNTSTTSPEIAEVLNSAAKYHNWIETVGDVEDAIDAHPVVTQVNRFDRYNPDHIDGQQALNDALAVEATHRKELRLAVAEGLEGSLDALASIAVLYSIDGFGVKPPASPCRIITVRGENGEEGYEPEEPTTVLPVDPPKSVDEVLTVAELIDLSTRVPRELIRNGFIRNGLPNKVVITERISGRGAKRWYKPLGDRPDAYTTITTTTTFDDTEVAPVNKPLIHPDENEISYRVPNFLYISASYYEQVIRPAGRPEYPAASKVTEGHKVTPTIISIPLIGAMLATGSLSEARLYSTLSTHPRSTERKLDVEINGFELPIDPREYLPKSN